MSTGTITVRLPEIDESPNYVFGKTDYSIDSTDPAMPWQVGIDRQGLYLDVDTTVSTMSTPQPNHFDELAAALLAVAAHRRRTLGEAVHHV